MGVRGPIPKRDAERRRQNKPETPTTTVKATGKVPIPAGDSSWHPIAKSWYRSLRDSGQSQFYEPSDWATAQYAAHLMSIALSSSRVSAQLVASLNSLLNTLLVTEGDRRRVRMEIDRGQTTAKLKPVAVMDDYRDAFGG